MKYLSTIILLTSLPIFTFGQSSLQKKDSSNSKTDNSGFKLKITASVDNVQRVRENRRALIDSLNNYSGGVLPSFLSDACIEHRRKYFEGFHTNECLRCTILDSVKNKNALQLILKSNNPDLDKTCPDTGYYYTPHDEESMRQLIKKRIEKME